MRIIDPQWTSLAKGYKAAIELEQQARKNWDAKWAQSVDFARQQGVKRAAEFIQAQIKNEKRTLRIVLMLLAGVILLMAIISTLANHYPQLSWFLLPVGIINSLQALVLLLPIFEKLKSISLLNAAEPPPEEPQTSLDITGQWWQAVTSQEALEIADAEGASQAAFLKYLAENLPNDYFAIRSPLIQKSLNVDVLLFGPTGIWLFEIKHWQGRVTCQNGVWQHEQTPEAQKDTPAPGPDAKWLDSRKLIEKTLNLRLARNANFGSLIRGGLVFTHPRVQVEIDASSTVQYGTPPQWLKRILATSKMAQFSTEMQLIVLDILFDYALSAYVSRPLLRSAVDLAKVLYGDVLEDLRQYILRQVRSRTNQSKKDSR